MTFDDHVTAALDSLPPQLAAALDNIAVVVEDGGFGAETAAPLIADFLRRLA